jgi:hypothetical protein
LREGRLKKHRILPEGKIAEDGPEQHGAQAVTGIESDPTHPAPVVCLVVIFKLE